MSQTNGNDIDDRDDSNGGTTGQASGGSAGTAEKDPSDWVTGGEPATGPQESYLGTLAQQAGEDAPAGLTKAEASEQIERLQEQTGRGQGG